jgi:hypothetical protein
MIGTVFLSIKMMILKKGGALIGATTLSIIALFAYVECSCANNQVIHQCRNNVQ